MRPLDPESPQSPDPPDEIDVSLDIDPPSEPTPRTATVEPAPVQTETPLPTLVPDERAPIAARPDDVPTKLLEPTPLPESPHVTLDGLRAQRRERTSRTGIFLPGQHFDADLDDLPPLDPPTAQESGWQYVTGRSPRPLRRLLTTRALPIVALSLIILWSYTQLRGERTPHTAVDGSPLQFTTIDAPTPPAPPTPTPEPDPDPEAAFHEEFPGLSLLETDTLIIRKDGSAVPVRMKSVLDPYKVTVINLWATYCAPCKEELTKFKQLFADQAVPWRDQVDFIPLQIDDDTTGAAARSEYAARMPAFPYFLSDGGLASGVKAAISSRDDIPKPWALPVTILVGCRGTIDRVYPNAIDTDAELRALFDDVQSLRKRMARCKPPAPAPFTPLPPKPMPTSLVATEKCGPSVCQKDETCKARPIDGKPVCIAAKPSWEDVE